MSFHSCLHLPQPPLVQLTVESLQNSPHLCCKLRREGILHLYNCHHTYHTSQDYSWVSLWKCPNTMNFLWEMMEDKADLPWGSGDA